LRFASLHCQLLEQAIQLLIVADGHRTEQVNRLALQVMNMLTLHLDCLLAREQLLKAIRVPLFNEHVL
jgi:hypothetical protein